MWKRIAIAVIASALSARAEPLDRIAVTIGTHVITESAVILDLRVGAFVDQIPVDLSPAAKRRAAERLTDLALILREAEESRLTLPSAEDAMAAVNLVKKQFDGEAAYRAELTRCEIKEEDLSAQYLAGMVARTFSEMRFRPAIQIPEADLRAYYERVKDGVSFEASRDEIERLLTAQRTEEELDAWLKSARAAAGVQFREKVFQ
jgi:hypothetical protein